MTKVIAKTQVADQLPAFMKDAQPVGTETLGQFITPPRLKVIQKMTREPLSTQFNVGDVIAMPMATLVASVKLNDQQRPTDEGEVFHFAPLLFYPEWCVWNPLELKGTLPAIRERTMDPKSALAVKSRAPETWSFTCPEMPNKDGKPMFCRIVEHLNFIVSILPPNPFEGVPVLLSFAKAEHKAGSNFAALIKMRRAPIYGCQFAGQAHHRKNDKGDWMGIDVTNPTDIKPFVEDEAVFNTYAQMHKELNEAYVRGAIVADYEDEPLTPPEESKF